MPATRRATVVLPVPGLPTNTRCRVSSGVAQSAWRRAAPAIAQHLGLVADLGLHRVEADERVELVEQLLERPWRGRPSARASPRRLAVPGYAAAATLGVARRGRPRRRAGGRDSAGLGALRCRSRASCDVAEHGRGRERRDREARRATRPPIASSARRRRTAAAGRGARATSRASTGVGAAACTPRPSSAACVELGPCGRTRVAHAAAAPLSTPRELAAAATFPGLGASRSRRRAPRGERGRRWRAGARSVSSDRHRFCGSRASAPEPNFSARNRPCAISASASARQTASKTSSIFDAEEVELIAQHRSARSCRRRPRGGRRSRAAGAGRRRRPRAGSSWPCAARRGPARCPAPSWSRRGMVDADRRRRPGRCARRRSAGTLPRDLVRRSRRATPARVGRRSGSRRGCWRRRSACGETRRPDRSSASDGASVAGRHRALPRSIAQVEHVGRVRRCRASEARTRLRYDCDLSISVCSVVDGLRHRVEGLRLERVDRVHRLVDVRERGLQRLDADRVVDAACLLMSTLWVASSCDVDSMSFDVVVLSAVIWSSTSFWFASAWATITAVRSAAIVVVVARSTPLMSSRLFFRTRSIAR